MTAQELLEQVPKLAPEEFEKFRSIFEQHWVRTRVVMPGIEKTPGVCGGSARVAGTRIAVWLLVEMRREGWSESQFLENYPTLDAFDLQHAWDYFAAEPTEIERDIHENEMEDEEE